MFRPAAALVLFVVSHGLASTKNPASNSQALTLAAQSISALTGGTVIRDVTLTGTVTWIAGSDSETGTGTLMALGPGESRMDLLLSSGTRTEIRDASTGTPLGKWFAPRGASGKFPFHNCETDAVWFFPALSSLAGGSNVVLDYIGEEDRSGEKVQHIRSYVYQPFQSSVVAALHLSTMDFYLDSNTFLPSAITFNVHPDNNAVSSIPIEVDFANYETVNDVLVPMHIQKYMQGTLMIDLMVSGAVFNSGISSSNFTTN
jgi:hypothetical protein